MYQVGGLRRDREADERTDAFALNLKGENIECVRGRGRPGNTPTTAFTSAARSAQIDPAQGVPAVLNLPLGCEVKRMLTIRNVIDACPFDYSAVLGKQSSTDAKVRVWCIRKYLGCVCDQLLPPDSSKNRGTTFKTRFDEEVLLFDGQRPGLGCSGHLIFSRSALSLCMTAIT